MRMLPLVHTYVLVDFSYSQSSPCIINKKVSAYSHIFYKYIANIISKKEKEKFLQYHKYYV